MLVLLVLLELAGRQLVAPSLRSYGTLLGIELPPVALPSPLSMPSADRLSDHYGDLIVDGKKIISEEFCYGKKFFANDMQGQLRKNRDFVARGKCVERQ